MVLLRQVKLRMVAAPVLRALAAAITLGSGASLGPEGPSVDIGRSSAQALGSLLRSKRRLLLPLIAAGSGAGAQPPFCLSLLCIVNVRQFALWLHPLHGHCDFLMCREVEYWASGHFKSLRSIGHDLRTSTIYSGKLGDLQLGL